jgi:hypothetical protein
LKSVPTADLLCIFLVSILHHAKPSSYNCVVYSSNKS